MEKEAIQNKEKNFVSCVLYLHNDGKNNQRVSEDCLRDHGTEF